ncbi:MAG: signal peptidase I [Oscillospiraceae bacterium]|nr:signal peptidase I [Oscillospiraceae bacterium]
MESVKTDSIGPPSAGSPNAGTPGDHPPDVYAPPTKKRATRLERELFDWLQTIVTSLILVSLLFSFVARVIGVVGPSMESTIFTGQKVLISNLFYTPKAGDVVVFTKKNIKDDLGLGSDDEPLVKRIIAVAGQTVNIDAATGDVSVDGIVIDEPYIRERTTMVGRISYPYTVEEGKVFVMGDNRNRSSDSRLIGAVDTRYILGRVLFRVWPLQDFGPLPNPESSAEPDLDPDLDPNWDPNLDPNVGAEGVDP